MITKAICSSVADTRTENRHKNVMEKTLVFWCSMFGRNLRPLFSVAILVCFTVGTQAQSPCNFVPDNEKILANKNLGYFLRSMTEPYEPFKFGHSQKEIPMAILLQYYCLIEDTLLADPGEMYNATDFVIAGAACRQLVFFALNNTCFVMVYHRGGLAQFTLALFMRFSSSKLVDVWVGEVGDDIKDLPSLTRYIQQHKSRDGEFPIVNEFNPGDYLSF